MWKAYLESVADNPVPDSTFVVNVRFDDDAGGGFTKQYQLNAGSNSTKEDLQRIIAGEIESIERLTATKTELQSLVGQELTGQ